MEIIMKIIYGILFTTSWILILKFRKQIKDFSGSFAWAETMLGRWGTYLVIIAIWAFLIFYGVIFPFGGMELFFKK